MLFLDLQLFASKKGVSSTKNGRDSESKRLGAKKSDGEFATAVLFYIDNVVLRFTQVKTLVSVAMTHYSH
jgi:ribosomal protein L27